MISKIFCICAISLAFFQFVHSKNKFNYRYYHFDYPGEIFVPFRRNHQLHDYKAANANIFLDIMLKGAAIKIKEKGLDPLTIPDTNKNVSQRLLVLVVEGGYSTTNGKLYGLSTIHRAGNATLENKVNNLEVVATLAVKDMTFETDAKVWLSLVNVPWRMSATIDYLKATITLDIPLNKLKGEKAKATSLTVNEIGEINIKFRDLGPLNWLMDGLGTLVSNMLKNVIKNEIAHKMLSAINLVIPKFSGMG